MGYQDRDYYRARRSPAMAVLGWLWSGRLPLFTVFGIRVQAHATLILCIGLGLLLGFGPNNWWQDRFAGASMLFVIVLLHEFGHCFACRWMGGTADEIVMHPLGGLALADPPRRPWPSFVTSAGGPLVNVAICAACAVFFMTRGVGPHLGDAMNFGVPVAVVMGGEASRWIWWTYSTSLWLLLFNLLPVYPLDGGRMLQEILWPMVGFYRSMMFSCIVGMITCVPVFMYAVTKWYLPLLILAPMGFMACYQTRQILLSQGPWGFEDEASYSTAYEQPRRRGPTRWSQWRVASLQRQSRTEQAAVDRILSKVSAQGMQSLSWWEKRTLRKASERQRGRDRAMAAARRRGH